MSLIGEGIPAGALLEWSLSASAPATGIKCNGALISRTTYSRLFEVIGTTYGVGDGSTTFAVPDFRGVFLRGLDESRGYDAGRSLGTYQADDFAGHTHGTNVITRNNEASGIIGSDQVTYPGSTNTGATGGAETRPKNMPIVWYIVY